MAPQTGLEPVTYRLTAGCSTIELLRNKIPQRLTLPERYHSSTISAEGLNFCVRDGNRCDPFAIVAEFRCQMWEVRGGRNALKSFLTSDFSLLASIFYVL